MAISRVEAFDKVLKAIAEGIPPDDSEDWLQRRRAIRDAVIEYGSAAATEANDYTASLFKKVLSNGS